jgi:hypothetical protein
MHKDLHSRDHFHSHPTRRDFFAQSLGGALASVSVLELAFNRAAWARALAQTVSGSTQLFDIKRSSTACTSPLLACRL